MVRAVIVSLLILLWAVLWLPLISIAHVLRQKKLRNAMVVIGHRGLLAAAGVKVKAVGRIAQQRPLLLVSNHISYLDIPILGSISQITFSPKREIAGWPVIGFCCKLMDCIFIDRDPRKVHEEKKRVHETLEQGVPLVIFPEATTGDGRRVLPFKSGFFDLAMGNGNEAEVMVQPVAICYRKINGLPIDSGQWPYIAWYGDMSLLPHLFTLFALGPIEVEVHFLPPVDMTEVTDRKILAQNCQILISQLVNGEALPAA